MSATVAPFIGHPISHSCSTICRPVENGAFRCDAISNGTENEKVAATILIALLVFVVVMVLKVWFDSAREEAEQERQRKRLEEDLSKTVSERMPK